MLVFVDTNILVYAFDPSQGERHRPAKLAVAELLETDRFCLSTQVLQELYVVLTRKAGLPAESTLAILEDLSQWTVFTVDYPAIRDAVRISQAHQLSFWDALLISSANRLGATELLTEDLNPGQTIHSVSVRSPF